MLSQSLVSDRNAIEGITRISTSSNRKLAIGLVAVIWLISTSSLLAVLILAGIAPAHFDPLVLARIYITGAFGGLLASVFSRHSGAIQIVISFFFTIFIALPALVQIETGVFPFKSSYSSFELNSGFFIIAVAHLFFLVGIVALRPLRQKTSRVQFLEKAASTGPKQSTRLAVIAICLALIALAVGIVAGPSSLFTARFESESSSLSGEKFGEQLAFVARGFSIVSLTLGLIAFKLSKPYRKGLRYPLLLLFVSAQCLVINYPPALPRFQLLAVLITIVVVLMDFHKARTKLIFCVSAAYFVLYIFPSIKDLRKLWTNEFELQTNQMAYLQTADFDSFKQIVDTGIYFASNSHRWGENFVGAMLFWVPRDLWTSKPVTTGNIVSEGLGYSYTNVSSPLPAEAFASFGMIGTLAILFLVGGVTARLDREALDSSSPIAFATCAIAAGYSTILMRGALNAVAPMIFPAFVILAIVFLVFSKLFKVE